MQYCNEKWQAGRKGRNDTLETVTPLLPLSFYLFLCASENKWTAKGREVPKIASVECTSAPLLLPVIASLRGNCSPLVLFSLLKDCTLRNMEQTPPESWIPFKVNVEGTHINLIEPEWIHTAQSNQTTLCDLNISIQKVFFTKPTLPDLPEYFQCILVWYACGVLIKLTKLWRLQV